MVRFLPAASIILKFTVGWAHEADVLIGLNGLDNYRLLN
jgi:hypothetical protein